MSEVASRGSGPRGRGSYRGGRGGHSARGGRGGSRQTPSDKPTFSEPEPEDQGEIGELKRKYASSVKIVQEMFPQYSSEDIVFAIEENGGDLEQTINKMTEGNVSTWEVTKKEKTKAPKTKDAGEDTTGSIRGTRGRGGADSARGGRGRATDRGRGASRGARGGSSATAGKAAKTADPSNDQITFDTTTPVPEPANDSAWGTEAPAPAPTAASPATSWEVVTPSEVPPPAAETTKASSKPDGTRTWASMLKPTAKPKPAPTTKPVTPALPQVHEPPAPVAELESAPEPVIETPPAIPIVEPSDQIPPSAPPSLPPSEPSTAAPVAPSEDKLTEENLEQVKDTSHPVVSETVASTIGTEEPRSVVGTPLPGQAATPSRPGLGGFATSALKATQGSSRAASFRRVKDQQEAVVMPGNHAVDRTAVQFGSLGLSGSAEDVDDDREEAETRAQPPQHSPIAPRASLPAAPQQPASESAPTPRAAPGLPSDLPQVTQAEAPAAAPQQQYDQFSNRFGGFPGAQAPGATNVSKPYEPFGQQLAGASHHPFEHYSSQSQAPGQQGQTAPSNLGGFGSGYDSYYNDYQRNAHLYGGFGQQGQSSQESGAAQRGAGAFGSSAADPASQYATSHATHNRFGGASDALNSGHSTPAPTAGQPAASQSQGHTQSHHLGNHGQASGAPYGQYGQYAGYNQNNAFSQMGGPTHHSQQPQQYGRDRPAFDDARRYDDPYAQQNYYGYGHNAYANGPYSGGKYGQPHQYGSGYDSYGASSANAFGREPAGASYGYGRAGSTQPESSQQGQHGASAYGGANDPFSRTGSGFPGQSSSQQTQGISGDENSRYGGDSSKIATGGPSPAPAQQRPDSTTNTSQSGPPQGQQGYNNYPHNLGGFGSGHQAGHQAGYGGFGAGAGYGNYSYGSNNRGQWGAYGGGH